MTFVDGPYRGVEFAINRVSLDKNVLNFHYDVLVGPQTLKQDSNFVNEIGDLVVYLLQNPFKIGKNVGPTPNRYH